jgi:hypothetical protein
LPSLEVDVSSGDLHAVAEHIANWMEVNDLLGMRE